MHMDSLESMRFSSSIAPELWDVVGFTCVLP